VEDQSRHVGSSALSILVNELGAQGWDANFTLAFRAPYRFVRFEIGRSAYLQGIDHSRGRGAALDLPSSLSMHAVSIHNEQETNVAYVDGFVVAVPKQKIEDYKALARRAGAVWKEHGALGYVECIGEDVPYGKLTSFPRAVQAKDDEIVIFSWIMYASREQRDQVTAKVMADPRLKHEMSSMPFDGKRMIYGGFEKFLEL
jgi:uncharacterized protein YbaA (DUF1428 family)